MARRPLAYAGRSSDDDETASSASFRLVLDDAASVDLQIDITDIINSNMPPPTRRRGKGRPRQNRSRKRLSSRKSHKSKKGSPRLSRLETDLDCSSSNNDRRCSQEKSRKPAALLGAARQNDDSDTHSSDDDCSNSGSDNDSNSDPDVDSDDEISSDSDDDGYADGTRRNITRMDERWERYCRKRNKKYRALADSVWADPASALRIARKKELTLFLCWCLRLRRGKNSRKLRGIKKFKSLDTDRKLFLRYYKKVTGEPTDDKLGRRIRKIRMKRKTPMFIKDVVPLQETTLRTMEKRFDLTCFTVNRINAMRRLQYQHLQCSIQRNPYGGPPRILLEIKYKFAKKYMGVTQAPWRTSDACGWKMAASRWRSHLKRDKAKHYVFCKVKSLKVFGEIAGFKWSLFTHRFRYGGGTILNESGLVSDAQQNLIIKHINRRRPRELTNAQKATVEHDPELQKVIRKRDVFSTKLQRSRKKSGRKLDKLDKLKRDVTNTRNRLLYALRQRVREEFDEEQAIHLLGKLITWPTSLSVEVKWQRRNKATEAVRLYCDVLEGGPRRGRRPKRTVPVQDTRMPSPTREVMAPTQPPLLAPSPSWHKIALQEAGKDIRTAAKPRACFQCYGNPVGFDNRRLQQYSRHRGLLRHFRAVHLDDRYCNYCNESVDNEMYWRKHTVDKHRLNVRYLGDYPHDL
ncbi:hypothetical protein BJY04DRAFT_228777 [Aspergillus karnatakaensis]|uniref:uncharacterized protein n=1 Tax=Aspergillus karnatakaensis TaxID=1810916 RepID=UPI003CCD5017